MIRLKQLPPIIDVIGSIGKLRILWLLSFEDELNVTAISKKTGLNHSRVKIHLAELNELEIIQEKCFGRIRIYRIDDAFEGGMKIKNFMRSWASSSDMEMT